MAKLTDVFETNEDIRSFLIWVNNRESMLQDHMKALGPKSDDSDIKTINELCADDDELKSDMIQMLEAIKQQYREIHDTQTN